jgi:hypothetical protein
MVDTYGVAGDAAARGRAAPEMINCNAANPPQRDRPPQVIRSLPV